MLEQRLQQQIFESADLQYMLADALVKPLAEAAQVLVACITSGGRVWVCGEGASAMLAQYLANKLMHGFERPRPALAAMALTVPAAGLGPAADPAAVFASQLQALAHPGDVLVVFSASGRTPSVLAAVTAAQGQDMSVVAFGGHAGKGLAPLMQETDVLVPIASERSPRIHEIQVLAIHGLCDAVDVQLLGEQESP